MITVGKRIVVNKVFHDNLSINITHLGGRKLDSLFLNESHFSGVHQIFSYDVSVSSYFSQRNKNNNENTAYNQIIEAAWTICC